MLTSNKRYFYGILLVIPVVLAIALFIYTGSGYSLSTEDARDVAYKNAGVSRSEVSDVTVTKEREGLRGTYRITFSVDGENYRYTIDGRSGSIISHSGGNDEGQTSTSQSSDQTEVTQDSSAPEQPAPAPAVSKDSATSTALNHAGLAATTVTNLSADLSGEGNEQVYTVHFDNAPNGLRYTYLINAQSGVIQGYSTESLSTVAQTPAQ